MPDLGDIVAVYGAVVATFVGWRQWRRERNPLSLAFDDLYPDWTDESPGQGYYRVRVVNRSDAPLMIESFGVGFAIDYRRLPKELIGNSRAMDHPFAEGAVRLEVFEK